jgi:hypothetical protein
MSHKPDNRVIARFLDGKLVRGTTLDFAPTKTSFHIDDGQGTHDIDIGDLKALFFVRDFDGDSGYHEKKGFFSPHAQGKKVMVEFLDGEVLFGYTLTYVARVGLRLPRVRQQQRRSSSSTVPRAAQAARRRVPCRFPYARNRRRAGNASRPRRRLA